MLYLLLLYFNVSGLQLMKTQISTKALAMCYTRVPLCQGSFCTSQQISASSPAGDQAVALYVPTQSSSSVLFPLCLGKILLTIRIGITQGLQHLQPHLQQTSASRLLKHYWSSPRTLFWTLLHYPRFSCCFTTLFYQNFLPPTQFFLHMLGHSTLNRQLP